MFRIIIGLFLIVLGFSALTGFYFFNFLFSLLIIVIGFKMIFGEKKFINIKSRSSGKDLNEVMIFSPIDKTVKSDDFKGGKVTMIFSGGSIDLSQVKTTEKNIDIEIDIIFGGGKLIVPKSWKINIDGPAIVGGYNDITSNSGESIIVNIHGGIVFGGLEITN
jgi:predicted membrane protein